MPANNIVHSSSGSVSVQKGRMLLADVELLKKNEFHRRRTVRIQQVRQQSKDIASHIRERCKSEERKQLLLYKLGEENCVKKNDVRRLASLQQQYENCLQDFGASHRAAACEPDAEEIINAQLQQSRYEANRRGRIAAGLLRSKTKAAWEKERQVSEHRHFVRGIEALRSAAVTTLPKKALPIKNRKLKKQPLREANHLPLNSIAGSSLIPTHISTTNDERVPTCIPPLRGLKSISELSLCPGDENVSSILCSERRDLKKSSPVKRKDEQDRRPVTKSPVKIGTSTKSRMLKRSAVERRVRELKSQGHMHSADDYSHPSDNQQRNTCHLPPERISSPHRNSASGSRSQRGTASGDTSCSVDAENTNQEAERISVMQGKRYKRSTVHDSYGGNERHVRFMEGNNFAEEAVDNASSGPSTQDSEQTEQQSHIVGYKPSKYEVQLMRDYPNASRGVLSLDGTSRGNRGLGFRSWSDPNIITDSENVSSINRSHQVRGTQWTVSSSNEHVPSMLEDLFHPPVSVQAEGDLQDMEKSKHKVSHYPPKEACTATSPDDRFHQILRSSPDSSPQGFVEHISKQLGGKHDRPESYQNASEFDSENISGASGSANKDDCGMEDDTSFIEEDRERDEECNLAKYVHREREGKIQSGRPIEKSTSECRQPVHTRCSSHSFIEEDGERDEECNLAKYVHREREGKIQSGRPTEKSTSECRQPVHTHCSSHSEEAENLCSSRPFEKPTSGKKQPVETTRHQAETAKKKLLSTRSKYSESQTSASNSSLLPQVWCDSSSEEGRTVRGLKKTYVACLLDTVTEEDEDDYSDEEEIDKSKSVLHSTDTSEEAEESEMGQTGRVQLYDHSNRFQHEYEQPRVVERVPISAVVTDACSEAEQESLKVAVAVQTGSSILLESNSRCQRRAREAMRRQRLEKELEGLLGSLGPLARKERMTRAGIASCPLTLHLDDYRLKEVTAVRQKNMDTAFEKLYHSSSTGEGRLAANDDDEEMETDTASTSVRKESPLRLNVGTFDPQTKLQPKGARAFTVAAASAQAPPSDLEALECLLERVRRQRANILQKLSLPLAIKRPAEGNFQLDTSGSSLDNNEPPDQHVAASESKEQRTQSEKTDSKASSKKQQPQVEKTDASSKKQAGGKYTKTVKKNEQSAKLPGQKKVLVWQPPQKQKQNRPDDKQGKKEGQRMRDDGFASQSSGGKSEDDDADLNGPASNRLSEYDIDVSLTRTKHGVRGDSSQTTVGPSRKEMKVQVHVKGRKKHPGPEERRKPGPCKKRFRKEADGEWVTTDVTCETRPGFEPVITIEDLDGKGVEGERPEANRIWHDKLKGPLPEESSSTAYMSPPDHLAGPYLVHHFESPPSNTCLRNYISRLLAMSKASVDALNVSSSDISIPSDIVEQPSNIRQSSHHTHKVCQKRSVAVCVTPSLLGREISQSPPPAAPLPPPAAPLPPPHSTHTQGITQEVPHPKYSNTEYNPILLSFPASRFVNKYENEVQTNIQIELASAYVSPQGHDSTQYKFHPKFANTEYRHVPSGVPPVSPSRVVDSPEYRAVAEPVASIEPPLGAGSPTESDRVCENTCPGPQLHERLNEASPIDQASDADTMTEEHRELKIDNLHLTTMSDRCAKRINDLTKMIENLRMEKQRILEFEIVHEKDSSPKTQLSPRLPFMTSPEPLCVPPCPLVPSPKQSVSPENPPLPLQHSQMSPERPKSPLPSSPKEIAITVSVLPAKSPEPPKQSSTTPTSPQLAYKPHTPPHPHAPFSPPPSPRTSPSKQPKSPPLSLPKPFSTLTKPAVPLYMPRVYLAVPPVPPDVPPLRLPADFTSTPRRPRPPPSLVNHPAKTGGTWQMPHELSTIVEADSVVSMLDEAVDTSPVTDMGKVVVRKSAGPQEHMTSVLMKMQEVLRNVTSEGQCSSEIQDNQNDPLGCPGPKQDDDDDEDDDTTPDIMDELLSRGVMTSPFGWMKRDSEEAGWENVGQKYECLPALGVTENICSQPLCSEPSVSPAFCPRHPATTPHNAELSKTAEPSSLHSSPEDLEGMFQRLGLGWASAMLRKTQETMAMSSSSSDNSHGPWHTASGCRGRSLSQAVSSLDGSQNTSSNDWCQSTPTQSDTRCETSNLFTAPGHVDIGSLMPLSYDGPVLEIFQQEEHQIQMEM